jgi:ubiquinone/menaquinone biosynthesis C-methylase UbiE
MEIDAIRENGITETQRLELQAGLIDRFTDDLFHRAGITPGMTVIDCGCGAGDVSFLLSGMVGKHGMVLGVDFNEERIDRAISRQKLRRNISFICHDISTLEISGVDAILGRMVLMHVKDPAATLRHLVSQATPGCIICFQEPAEKLDLVSVFRDAGLKSIQSIEYEVGEPFSETPTLTGVWATV